MPGVVCVNGGASTEVVNGFDISPSAPGRPPDLDLSLEKGRFFHPMRLMLFRSFVQGLRGRL